MWLPVQVNFNWVAVAESERDDGHPPRGIHLPAEAFLMEPRRASRQEKDGPLCERGLAANNKEQVICKARKQASSKPPDRAYSGLNRAGGEHEITTRETSERSR